MSRKKQYSLQSVLEAVEERTIDREKLKLVFSNEELKDKVRLSMEPGGHSLWWYITFNIPLDVNTLNETTIQVTDLEGYIVDTAMKYEFENHRIAIRPAIPYTNNEYYILNILNKVKAQQGQPLKENIHILFKVVDNKVSEIEILKSTVKVPKARRREKDTGINKYYSFLNAGHLESVSSTLPFIEVSFPLIPIILAAASFVASMVAAGLWLPPVLISLGVLFSIISLYQILQKEPWSRALYNFGVMAFNKEKYKQAHYFFEKAYKRDMTNESAEYAYNKSKFYNK